MLLPLAFHCATQSFGISFGMIKPPSLTKETDSISGYGGKNICSPPYSIWTPLPLFMILIPERLKRSEFEEKLIIIERKLKELYLQTDSLWANSEKINQLFLHQ